MTALPTVEWTIDVIDLEAMSRFFVDDVGFARHLVRPADDPQLAVLVGHGVRLALRRSSSPAPAMLTVDVAVGDDRAGRHAVGPDGTVVTWRSAGPDGRRPLEIPVSVPSLTVTSADSEAPFGRGRAGMGYRDLLPDRWGGRFIVSHIRIDDGGDVPDWVHFHDIRFQLIYVAAGWVDVVYEDQGDPFRLVAGDCVLQPPLIRHRVLRSSPGLEVIEVGCPAEHDTLADNDLALPTSTLRPDRDFGGQRFVRHVAATALRHPAAVPGLVVRDTRIGLATGGLAGVTVLERDPAVAWAEEPLGHDGEFVMYVVLRGTARLRADSGGDAIDRELFRADSIALPPGADWRWSAPSDDFEVLCIELPEGAVERRK